MVAFFDLIGRFPQPWERELLLSYDHLYMQIMTAEDVVEIGSDGLQLQE
ncbi:hypothetical protein HMPREF9371_0639 [Neisseria shayeganii 871]|uniref:Uncharacterized protein n=1 Tax=Neisseria shayeganii 871 TaxID=1032488 RepID=G4CGA0_9NEIS|nr:hypothetical protein HMPREF9371_0639 [Neisseria shayeganii 871]